MPQLLVRNIEPAIVKKLRARAADLGISVEEAHRRLLRSALTGDQSAPRPNFAEYLLGIPRDDEIEFTRSSDPPRKIKL